MYLVVVFGKSRGDRGASYLSLQDRDPGEEQAGRELGVSKPGPLEFEMTAGRAMVWPETTKDDGREGVGDRRVQEKKAVSLFFGCRYRRGRARQR